MNFIFKNIVRFTIVFFTMLIIDIVVKETLPAMPYRYFTKPLIVLLLALYYWLNRNKGNKNFGLLTFSALFCFLLGDIFLIKGAVDAIFLAIGISFFILGKAVYCFRFSHSKDFNITRLIPFFIICFVFMTVMFVLIYDNLGEMFYPILIYIFVTIMMLQFAYLRREAVEIISKESYYMVLIGALIAVISDSVTGLKEFHAPIPYQEIFIMFFYGISQYLIIVGLVKGEVAEGELIKA